MTGCQPPENIHMREMHDSYLEDETKADQKWIAEHPYKYVRVIDHCGGCWEPIYLSVYYNNIYHLCETCDTKRLNQDLMCMAAWAEVEVEREYQRNIPLMVWEKIQRDRGY